MKKKFTRWLVVMMSIIMVLSTSLGALASEGSGSASSIQDAYIKKTDSSMGMFVNNASVKVIINADGSKEAVFTFVRDKNTYPRVFLGTVEEANAADAASDTSRVYEAVAVEGGYQYTVPLENLDAEFALSLYSSSQNSWRENTLIVTLSDPSHDSSSIFKDGTYVGVGSVPGGKYPTDGYDISVTVDIKDDKITGVKYTDALPNDGNISYKKWTIDGHYSYDETSKVWSLIKGLAEQLIGKSSTAGIDAVTGATKTSNAVLEGVNAALDKAKTGETAPTTPPPVTTPEKADVLAKTGIYTVDVECNGLTIVDAQLTSKNETMTAMITLSGTGYDLLFFGTEVEAMGAGENALIQYCGTKEYINDKGAIKTGYQFEIPVASLDKDISFISHAKSSNNWFYRTIKFDSASLTKIGEPEVDNPEVDNPETNIPNENNSEVLLPDGTYSVTVDTGAKMFKIVDCKLVVEGEKVTAVVTLSSNGYDYLYAGTAAEAEAADFATWNKWVKEIPSDGKTQRVYTLSMTKEDLTKGLAIASHSESNNSWFDRSMNFDLESMKVYSVGTSVEDAINNVVSDKVEADTNTGSGNTGNSGSAGDSNTGTSDKDDTLTEDEIKDKLEDVDDEKVVKDGTYKPEFGFTGGSGRATISCSKVVVKDGKATATIKFSSPNFTWVKSLGKTVTNENKGGNSTFTIPVNLNGKTNITAETAAMSQPYEVEYTLYCFIDGTKVTTSTPSKSDDVIELEGTIAPEKDDAATEDNAWGAFDDDAEAGAGDVTTGAVAEQSNDTLVKVLTVALILVCIYAAAGTVFAVARMRKMKGE